LLHFSGRPEFVSLLNHLKKWVVLDDSRPNKPTDNPFIESFEKSITDECLNANCYVSLIDSREKIEHWKLEYKGFRSHSSLDNVTPNKVYEKSKTHSESLLLA